MPDVGVLAPHVRLGRRQEDGGGKGEARLTSPGRPLCPCYVYIGRTNGLLSHRPISNPNPSWAFKPYCDDGLLGISPTPPLARIAYARVLHPRRALRACHATLAALVARPVLRQVPPFLDQGLLPNVGNNWEHAFRCSPSLHSLRLSQTPAIRG
jgi:hypothetical protein